MAETFDMFLSYGTPDRPWVETLAQELDALGLQTFLDAYELEAGDTFPVTLSNALRDSRFLVLILSPHSVRPWVELEWTSFMAKHGPLGRILPVMLEAAEVPTILEAVQRIDGTHRDAARVAAQLAVVVGRPEDLLNADARSLAIGQDLTFVLSLDGDDLTITNPQGKTRRVTAPWKVDNRFGLALHFYDRLTRRPVTEAKDRAELFERATTLGSILFEALFGGDDRALLDRAVVPGRPRPLITLRSNDDLLLSFPWELLHFDCSFLLRDARVDVARSTLGEVGPSALLPEPEDFLKLVVNVSAPEGSGLEYEAESYRITKALTDRCPFVPTELGTLEDLVETVQAERPKAIHFSGHGTPGALIFEDDEGRSQKVQIADMLRRLRERVSGGLPPLFYLASCHGNDPGEPATAAPEEVEEGSESSAARLHREGVPQVVGYYGPIVDELSTRAEEEFYRAIAEGGTTRYAVRQARVALAAPFGRPGGASAAPATVGEQHTYPFAWAQLVLYHRGPDQPLSLPAVAGVWRREAAPRRTFTGAGNRRLLSTGFIGRRNELHRVRRWLRRGERVFVYQGLGGLGKSTLAFQTLPMLGSSEVVTFWCQETEDQPDRAEALVGQLLEFCRMRFGGAWESVVHRVDRVAGADSGRRFELFFDMLLRNVEGRVAVYLDNLESLLVGPIDANPHDETALGEWSSPALAAIWQYLANTARDSDELCVVASCRYLNSDFASALFPVSPLPPDALFRLTSWFPALRRLSVPGRAQLVEILDGHPRAVEFANDLVAHALAVRENRQGPWKMPAEPAVDDLDCEWRELVEPVLPTVRDRLWSDLLLAQIWDRAVGKRARRMLYRMTLLRRPWTWNLMALLGEPDEDEAATIATAESLRDTSLLEQMTLGIADPAGGQVDTRRYTLHTTTAEFIRERFGNDEALRLAAHRRLGEYLETETKASPLINTTVEAGYHLFQAGDYERACRLLGPASAWLRQRGHVREGLQILQPFLTEAVLSVMKPVLTVRLLGTVGLAYARLGEMEKAIGIYKRQLVIAGGIGDRRGEGAALDHLGHAYAQLGEYKEAIGYNEQALVIAREIGDRQGEGAALGNLGIAYTRLGEMEKAIGYNEQALVIAREIGDRQSESAALGNLGSTYYGLGEAKKAIGYFERQLVIAREIGDRRGEDAALRGLGLAYTRLREVRKAIDYYEQALVVARGIGDRHGEGAALDHLGSAYSSLAEVEKAIGYHKQALVIAREIGDRRGEGSAVGNLGSAYYSLGEVEKAITYQEEALLFAREIGSRRGEGITLSNLGNAYADLGKVERAIGYYEQALDIAREIGARYVEGNVLGNLGISYTRMEEPEKAIGYCEQSLAISREIGDLRGEGSSLGNLGMAYAALGEVERATALLERSLEIGRAIEDSQIQDFASERLAQLPSPPSETTGEEVVAADRGGGPKPQPTPVGRNGEPEARCLQADVFVEKDGESLRVERAFVAGRPHSVAISIGRGGGIQADVPFEEPDPLSPEGFEWLDIRVQGIGGAELSSGWIKLPHDQARNSERHQFRLAVGMGAETVSLLVTVLHGGRILQRVRLTGPVVASIEEEEHSSAMIEMAVQVEVHTPDHLEGRSAFDAAVVVGEDSVTAFSGRGLTAGDLGGIHATMERITRRLFEESKGVAIEHGVLGEGTALDLLRYLAVQGRSLYTTFVKQIVPELEEAESIQIVPVNASSYLPLEFVYSGREPTQDATLCAHWQQALKHGACPDCLPDDGSGVRSEHICPLGFWSLSKLIERHAVSRSGDGQEFRVGWDQGGRRTTLHPLRRTIWASSDKVPKEAIDGIGEFLESLSPGAREVPSWQKWRDQIRVLSPTLLVSMPHNAFDPNLEVSELELSRGPALRIGEVSAGHVRNPDQAIADEDRPVVLLLGCKTGQAAAHRYLTFVGGFRISGAAVVIGTLSTVLARHSPPLVKELVQQIAHAGHRLPGETVPRPRRLGALMLRARRELFTCGFVVALGVVAFGDADWRIEGKSRENGDA